MTRLAREERGRCRLPDVEVPVERVSTSLALGQLRQLSVARDPRLFVLLLNRSHRDLRVPSRLHMRKLFAPKLGVKGEKRTIGNSKLREALISAGAVVHEWNACFFDPGVCLEIRFPSYSDYESSVNSTSG